MIQILNNPVINKSSQSCKNNIYLLRKFYLIFIQDLSHMMAQINAYSTIFLKFFAVIPTMITISLNYFLLC